MSIDLGHHVVGAFGHQREAGYGRVFSRRNVERFDIEPALRKHAGHANQRTGLVGHQYGNNMSHGLDRLRTTILQNRQKYAVLTTESIPGPVAVSYGAASYEPATDPKPPFLANSSANV